ASSPAPALPPPTPRLRQRLLCRDSSLWTLRKYFLRVRRVQVSDFRHVTGAKADRKGHFVAGLLRRWQCFHRLTRPGCAYLLPPNLLRPLPLNPRWQRFHFGLLFASLTE